MIIGFIGLPGQGKSLGMVNNACRDLKDGKRVISNVPFTDTIYGSKKSAEYRPDIKNVLMNERNCVVCIDEASIYLNSREWEKLPKEILMRFAQTRKFGVDIYYTSQGWMHTEKRLRDLTNFVIKCTQFKLFFKYEWIDPEYYAARVQAKYKKDYLVKTQFITPFQKIKVFKAYNTYHIIDSNYIGEQKTGEVQDGGYPEI